MGSTDNSEIKEKQKLYLRLPERIIDEQQIKALHSCITKVFLPRQKSRRWCTIEFDNSNYTSESVIKILSKVHCNGKKIYVNLLRKKTRPVRNQIYTLSSVSVKEEVN